MYFFIESGKYYFFQDSVQKLGVQKVWEIKTHSCSETGRTLYPHLRICLLILEREEGRERETAMWERNINRMPPIHAPTGYWTHNLGMCPDRKLILQSFGAWDDSPTNWPTKLGPEITGFKAACMASTSSRKYYLWVVLLISFIREQTKNRGHMIFHGSLCLGHPRGKQTLGPLLMPLWTDRSSLDLTGPFCYILQLLVIIWTLVEDGCPVP